MQGVFQRAAVATLLIGTLVAPVEICMNHAQKAGHDCCASMSQPGTAVQNDCCVVRSAQPAAVVSPNLPGPAPLTVAHKLVSSNDLSSQSELPASAVIPPQSPSTGASILRI